MTSERRYLIEFLGAMLAYAVVLFISVWLLNRLGDETIWRIPLALAPMIPIGLALWAFLRQLGRMDELQRRIQLDAIATAAGATSMITFTYGLLENAGFPQLSWIWILPMLIALWGIGIVIASRRYE